jgi:putative acetyltransferase
MYIRTAEKKDLPSIQNVIKTSFPIEEHKLISILAKELSDEISTPPVKSFIAEIDKKIIGYVSFSPIFFKLNTNILGYILSPLAVSSNIQNQGVGTKIVNFGIGELTKKGVHVLLVYGDPGYYKRFGFNEDIGNLFVHQYTLKYPFGWLGIKLNSYAANISPIEFECIDGLNKPELW